MNFKKILTLSVLATAIGVSTSTFAANSATSSSVLVSLTLGGSCTVDASLTNGVFAGTASGSATKTLTKNSDVSVTCTSNMPFKLGVTGGANYTGTSRALTNGVNPDILYTVQQSGTALGDFDIVSYDTSYTATSTENAYNSIGTGTAQTIPVSFVATVPAGQSSGTYTDNVAFVVAWP